MDRFFEQRAGWLTGLACLAVIVALEAILLRRDFIPCGSGSAEALRGVLFAAALHAGNGAEAWKILTHPVGSVISPQMLVFLLFPFGAGLKAYTLVLIPCTYALWAVGVMKICKVLDRRAWAPALFLFCAANNFSFDYPHLLDFSMQAGALGLLAITYQIKRWRGGSPKLAFRTGAFLGLTYWISPVMGVALTLTCGLAEVMYRQLPRVNRWLETEAESWEPVIDNSIIRLLCTALLVALPALLLGADRVIWQAVRFTYSLLEAVPHPVVTNSFLYYPFCLCYFYQLKMVIVLALLSISAMWTLRREEQAPERNRRHTAPLLSLGLACFLMGDSLGQLLGWRAVNYWIFTLPIAWLIIFNILDMLGLKARSLLVLAVAWMVTLCAQVNFAWDTPIYCAPNGDVLRDDCLMRFPVGNSFENRAMIEQSVKIIRNALPNGGDVGVSSETIFLDDRVIAWALRRPSNPYQVYAIFDQNGDFDNPALLSSTALVCFLEDDHAHELIQLRSRVNFLNSWLHVQFSKERAESSVNVDGRLVGTVYLLPGPLSEPQVKQLKQDWHDRAYGKH